MPQLRAQVQFGRVRLLDRERSRKFNKSESAQILSKVCAGFFDLKYSETIGQSCILLPSVGIELLEYQIRLSRSAIAALLRQNEFPIASERMFLVSCTTFEETGRSDLHRLIGAR